MLALSAIEARVSNQRPSGPLCAVGSVVGEHSRETRVKSGASGGSLPLTNLACQQKSLQKE
jgi:hypothetical protein